MVHLEMSYLTHSKFPIMIIPDILPPIPLQGLEIFDEFCDSHSLLLEVRIVLKALDVPSPFRTRSGNFNILILRSSVRGRFRVSADFITSFLFRTRFEVVSLSSSA